MYQFWTVVLDSTRGEDAFAVADLGPDAVARAGARTADHATCGEARSSWVRGAVDHPFCALQVVGIRRDQGHLDLHVLAPLFRQQQHPLTGLFLRLGIGHEAHADAFERLGFLE
ncbi:hypothetical protein D9M68_548770 [compost metagenome]